jgi:hypothetical protein
MLPAPVAPAPTPCLPLGAVEPLAAGIEAAPDDTTDSRNPWPGLRDSGLLAGWELPE